MGEDTDDVEVTLLGVGVDVPSGACLVVFGGCAEPLPPSPQMQPPRLDNVPSLGRASVDIV